MSEGVRGKRGKTAVSSAAMAGLEVPRVSRPPPRKRKPSAIEMATWKP